MPIDALAVWADIQANPGTALVVLIAIVFICVIGAILQHAADSRSAD